MPVKMKLNVGDLVEVDVDSVQVGDRFRVDMRSVHELAEEILKVGQLHPVGIDPERRLVFGARRHAAHRHLNRRTILARVVPPDTHRHMEISENRDREDLTVSERVRIGRHLEALIGDGRKKASRNPETTANGRTADEVAARAGFGNRETYRQAKIVCASGRADLIAQMDSSEISIAQAYRVLEAETRPKAPDVTPIDDDANEPEPAAKGPASDSKAGPAAAPPQEAGAASCGSVPQADGAPTTAPPVPDVVTGAGAPAARIVEQADCVVVYLPRAAWQAALLDIAEPSEKFEKMVSQGLIVLWDGDSRMSQDPAPMAAPAQATQAE